MVVVGRQGFCWLKMFLRLSQDPQSGIGCAVLEVEAILVSSVPHFPGSEGQEDGKRERELEQKIDEN